MTDSKSSAETGKDRILQAAEKLFIKQGFDATSCTKIAKLAGVTRSLIFHHFDNKQALWDGVKQLAVSRNNLWESKMIAQASIDLDNFIDIFIQKRFQFYRQNPNFTRMIAWQSLEIDSIKRSTEHINKWKKPLQQLQQAGHITQKYDAATLLTLIIASTTGFMVMHLVDFIGEENIDQYLQLLTHEIKRILDPTNE